MGLKPFLKLKCGRCIGCRLNGSAEWAARCMHEAQLHKENSFLTLTKRNLETPSLVHRDFQLFFKRLREHVSRLNQKATGGISSGSQNHKQEVKLSLPNLRYYMSGEYGSRTNRPHYHCCLFGYAFPDRRYLKQSPAGFPLYESPLLDATWQLGYANLVPEITYESAAYIARYIMNKQTGPGAWKYYEHIDTETGEITDLKPEYNKMSLRPAIGKLWLQKYQTDVYPHGELTIKNQKRKTPKYYDNEYKKKDEKEYEKMKIKRQQLARQYLQDNTPERLATKERVKKAELNRMLRNLD